MMGHAVLMLRVAVTVPVGRGLGVLGLHRRDILQLDWCWQWRSCVQLGIQHCVSVRLLASAWGSSDGRLLGLWDLLVFRRVYLFVLCSAARVAFVLVGRGQVIFWCVPALCFFLCIGVCCVARQWALW